MEALRRNLYGTVTPRDEDLAFMAAYLTRQAELLATQDAATIIGGTVAFTGL